MVSGHWKAKQLKAEMRGGHCRSQIASVGREVQALSSIPAKLPVGQFLDSLLWLKVEGLRPKVARLSQFAEKLGYKSRHELNKNARSWNGKLQGRRVAGRLVKKKLKKNPHVSTAGKSPWVGTRSTLKASYELL